MATFPLALEHARLDAHNAAKLIEIARDTEATPIARTPGVTPGGDERRLRGIPAIGRNVQGVIRGTRPDDILSR